MSLIDLRSLTLPQLEEFFTKNGYQKFRASQLFSWIHSKRATSFDEMSSFSKALRSWLNSSASLPELTLTTRQVSQLDGTVKYLFSLPDGCCIETVEMDYTYGTSLCISSQVGCKMGCGFCASTIGGLVRNLTTGEILSQVYAAERLSGKKASRIVIMGIGEPLDNFDNIIRFLELISHPKGKNLSLRGISLSTCGLVPEIKALADLKLPVTLCVSLHATTDKKRSEIMPINTKYSLVQLLAAARYYFDKTGRRITFEYALIKGVNDSPEDAAALASLISGINSHVNLIPVNPIGDSSFLKTSRENSLRFSRQLTDRGINNTIRRELGSDISAACGQLRHETASL